MGCIDRYDDDSCDRRPAAMKKYFISVPAALDDSFQYDATTLNIILVSESAKIINHEGNETEYIIIADEKQLTMLVLKGYKVMSRTTPTRFY
jgi:hypothetical protein